MLNELYMLSKALSDMRIETRAWHREYKELPKVTAKAPCLRIWISEDGNIKRIDELQSETVQKLRRYGNNQASFPAFNIKPLYRLTDDRQKKTLEEMREKNAQLRLDEVKSWCVNDNWHKSLKNIDNKLADISGRLLKAIDRHGNNGGQVVTRLIHSFCALRGGLRAALETHILSSLENSENVSVLLSVLIHSGDANKSPLDDMGNNISVILDLTEWEECGYPVASEETTVWINSVLMCADAAEDIRADEHAVDAFGSRFDPGKTEPMGSVKLPGFDVTLRTMFHEQRCQQRYGLFDDASYPIAKENRVAAKQALEWMAIPEHEDVTWKRADKDEIVFAYPSELTEIPLKYASILGPPPGKEGVHAAARFKECAEDFCRTFNGLLPEKQPKNICIFSIRKMDRARSKVVLTRNCSSEWFIKAAEIWQFGNNNVPVIRFVEPVTPFPLQVARIVNTVWKRDGKQTAPGKTLVKRMQYYQGMELLIDPPNNEAIRHYLRALLSNAEGLFYFICNNFPGDIAMPNYYAAFIAEITAVLGLLLYKGGYTKEGYMQNAAYMTGQLLKASNELHTLYCKVVRNGDVPPQLAGSSMFATAVETPDKALAQLCLRMTPYISWATQYRSKDVQYNENDIKTKENKGKESWRAGWYLYILEDIAEKLKETLVESARFNDFEKAQMFLGYIGKLPKREKPKNTSHADVDTKVNVPSNLNNEENENE